MNAAVPCHVLADINRHIAHEDALSAYEQRLERHVEALLDEQMATPTGWDRFGQQAGAAEWAALDGLLARVCRAASEEARIEAQRDLSALFARSMTPALRGEAADALRGEQEEEEDFFQTSAWPH